MTSKILLRYTPHIKQREVHEDNHRFKVIVCGRRFGKTTLAINELIRCASQADCKDITREYWYIAPTYKMAKMIAWEMLKRYIPNLLLKKVNESELFIQLINGARIFLKGSEDEDKLRGAGLDGVVLDEFADIKRSVWTDVIRPMLMDRKGWAIFLGTPKGQNHFYEHFIRDKDQHDPDYRDINDLSITVDSDYRSWRFETNDNPYIPPEEIEKMRMELSEDVFNQEVKASFENYTGLVYKEFNANQATLIIDPITIQPWWDVYVGLDTGKYTGALFKAIDDKGNEYIFDELLDIGGLCADIANDLRLKMAKRKISGQVIDSASQVKREYTSHGLYFQDSQKDILSSIQMTRRKQRDKKWFVFRNCKAFIRELKSRRWNEKSEDAKPLKANDHLCNAEDYIQFTFLKFPSRPKETLKVERDKEYEKIFKKKTNKMRDNWVNGK